MAALAPSLSGRGAPGRIEPVPALPARLLHDLARRGWVEDPRLAVALLAAAVLLVAGYAAAALLARRSGRRLTRLPRWSTRLGVAAPTAVLVLLGGAVAVNSYVGYVPSLGSVTGAAAPPRAVVAAGRDHQSAGVGTGSLLVRIRVDGASLGMADKPAYVYLPPGYTTRAAEHRRYPVVYLIHGSPGSAIDWVRAGRLRRTMDALLAAHLVGPMIVVAPSAAPTWTADDECLDAPGGPRLDTYLTQTVVAAVDARFRTRADRADRAIGGMSSGAFCALNLGLRHLARFSVILASEPYGDPGTGPLRRLLHGNRALWLANAPSYYLRYRPFPVPVATFLDAGTADAAGSRTANLLAGELAARGQLVGLRLAPGLHHTWYTARLELPYALVFAWHHFGASAGRDSDAADAAAMRAVEVRAARMLVARPRAS
jgi:hypothetical protein